VLKGIDPLLSPDLLHALAAMGHGDEVVVAFEPEQPTRQRVRNELALRSIQTITLRGRAGGRRNHPVGGFDS